ncbi:ABC transporter ATP-binding protein [Salinactinospora qingdaonensis]|uniref:ABC transporter ATP-binding protein n=1 Tax=Salinactinospora qingdaonensis TaxID=702744 RepID=A0ABP7GGG0_9ACTN
MSHTPREPASQERAADTRVPAPPVVSVRGLTALAGPHRIVDDVGFDIAAGEVLALVGASGSGKTTTGLSLVGDARAGVRLEGSVDMAGTDVLGSRPPAGAVAYLPQHPAAVLNPVRRIGGVLREIARRHAVDDDGAPPRRIGRREIDARIAAALRRTLLPPPEELFGRFAHQLSGGQQQRLVFAQSLLCRARLLVVDEPTTGQDPLTRQRVAAELGELAGDGMAVLLLTHDLDLVRDLATGVLVLRDGGVVERGTTEDVLYRPQHPYTRSLTRAHFAGPGAASPESGAPAQAAPGPPRIEVVDLIAGGGRRRGARPILDTVGFRLAAGECLALVGPSGSGKTTLARCVAGLAPRRAGTVRRDGAPLPAAARRSRTQRARVQYVFQDARASFDEYRTIGDQVARSAVRLRGLAGDRARGEAVDMLARTGLSPDHARRRPAALSGGELRRAALARALLAGPEVLICDEITAGLDAVTRAGILDLLADLRQSFGISLLVIAHDMAVVARLAGRVLVLDGGRVVEEGSVDRVVAAPTHPLTRDLLDAAGAHRDSDGATATARTRDSPSAHP